MRPYGNLLYLLIEWQINSRVNFRDDLFSSLFLAEDLNEVKKVINSELFSSQFFKSNWLMMKTSDHTDG